MLTEGNYIEPYKLARNLEVHPAKQDTVLLRDYVADAGSMMSSDATFGHKVQKSKLPVRPYRASFSKFDPDRDYDIDLGPKGNEKQLADFS